MKARLAIAGDNERLNGRAGKYDIVKLSIQASGVSIRGTEEDMSNRPKSYDLIPCGNSSAAVR
jgi:hypothetical protein